MPECTCIHESQCTCGPGCKTAQPSEITVRADVGLVERLQQGMAGEDRVRELERRASELVAILDRYDNAPVTAMNAIDRLRSALGTDEGRNDG